jgi:prepilin-type N-terminal cleavage/methylation domain-containing protein
MHEPPGSVGLASTNKEQPMVRPTRGFTLVELLVVISIIVLLVGIMVPSLEKAMAASQRGRCAANLSGIGKALGTYLNDSLARVYPRTTKWYGLLGQGGTANGYQEPPPEQAPMDIGGVPVPPLPGLPTDPPPTQYLGSAMRPLNRYLGISGARAEVKIAECPSDAGAQFAFQSDPSMTTSDFNTESSNVFQSVGTSYVEAFANRTGIQAAFGPSPMQAAAAKPASSKILLGDAPIYGKNKYADSRKNRWHQSNRNRREFNILFADYSVQFYLFPHTDAPMHEDNIEKPIGDTANDIKPSRGFW